MKEKSRIDRYNRGSGLGTGKPDGADYRDVFKVARKAFVVNYNYVQDAVRDSP